MNLQQLLSQITALSKKYDLLNERTGGFFNVFEIANVAHDEITVCRMIYELLSPSGSHCQGTLYLKLFLEGVLQIQVDDTELETMSVYQEIINISFADDILDWLELCVKYKCQHKNVHF